MLTDPRSIKFWVLPFSTPAIKNGPLIKLYIPNYIHRLDKDECRGPDQYCAHKCVNTEGSFKCECRKGYILVGRTNCYGKYEWNTDHMVCARFEGNTLKKVKIRPNSFQLQRTQTFVKAVPVTMLQFWKNQSSQNFSAVKFFIFFIRFIQIKMNVTKEMHVANITVSILKVPMFVAVIEDTYYIVMKDRVLVSYFKVLVFVP